MPTHKPEEYINILAFYSDKSQARLLQQQASDENQPLDVVYYDHQFECWRNFDFCSPLTQEKIQEYKRKHGFPSVP